MARDDQQDASSAADRGGADADKHVVSDEHGTRATGPATGRAGTGIERLSGLPGGTPTSGGVGTPGAAGGLGQGSANAPDTAEGGRGGQRNGAETGGRVERGSSDTPGPRVLANGGTRAEGNAAGTDSTAGTQAAGDTVGEDDPLALARQAGQNAMDHGPSSTGGTLQRPRAVSSDAAAAGGTGSDPHATTASPATGTTPNKSEGTPMKNHDPGPPVNPDKVSGSGMGAAANDADRGGAEAATAARSGGGPAISGSPPPSGAPPAPITPDPYGGTISESHADPGFPPPIPEQPTPGLTREPGPEAQT